MTESETLLETIEREIVCALDLARGTRAGTTRGGYANPFDTGNQWIRHAHELLAMRAKVLSNVPQHALDHIAKLEEDLAEVRKEFSELFRISMENGREATAFLADAYRNKQPAEAAS